MNINDIIAGLSSRVSAVLGPDYSQLPYVIDVSKNNYNSNAKRYGVRALTATETASVTKNVTQLQSFEITLTDAYYESKLDDSAAVQTAHNLQDSVLDIYKDLINTKAGAPSVVMNISNLIVSEPEYLDDSKVVVIRATMDILHRISLI